MESEHLHDVYKGEWNDDKPSGKGIYYQHSLSLITEGTFKDGKLDTQGFVRIRYPNGNVYEGYLQSNKKNGKGKLYYSNGDVYEGEWVNNKREGSGNFYIKSEDTTIEGHFNNDEIVRGKLIDKAGNVYTTLEDDNIPGRFVSGKLHGKIRIQYSNSNVFIGYFYDG